MPTFRLFAKNNIGSGKNIVGSGAFLQICKKSTTPPTSVEIKKAIKEQLAIDVNTTPHLGQFKWEMIK